MEYNYKRIERLRIFYEVRVGDIKQKCNVLSLLVIILTLYYYWSHLNLLKN